MSAPEQHALLSASSADRWLHCPGSVKLTKDLPEVTSEYAEEGRLAHAIAELKVRKRFVEPMSQKAFTTRMNKLKKDPRYQEEMQGYTDEYVDFINEICLAYPAVPFVAVEKRLDLTRFIPDGFGTGDCIIIGGNILHIVDFKYGKGVPVAAEGNPQLQLYALGAIMAYYMLYDIQTVRMSIVQPRLHSITTAEMTRDALIDWGTTEVTPRAKLAYDGTDERHAGDWCQFCKICKTCRERSQQYTALEAFADKSPALLSDAEIGQLLERARGIKKWVKDLEDHALQALLDGREIPGWKCVAGKSNRAFNDIDKAFAVLQDAGYDPALLYEKKPLPLTAIEKLVGKKDFDALLGGYVIKPAGAPALAEESDGRPVYCPAEQAFGSAT